MDELREDLRGLPMPSSTEAEISVLGAMLQDSTAVLRAAELLKAEDFYLAEHQEIFSAMLTLYQNRSPIDLITVHAELSRRGSLDGVGGDAYLLKLMAQVPTVANVRAYMDIVLEKSTLRKLITACREISRDCYTQQKPVQETLSSAEKAIFDIVMNRTDGETLKPLREVLVNTYEEIEELAKLKGQIAGVPTGFVDLDNMLTGMHAGELIILGARPSMGKTSLAMNIAGNACFGKGKAVYLGDFFYSPAGARMLLEILLYLTGTDGSAAGLTDQFLAECAWFPESKTLVVMNNSDMPMNVNITLPFGSVQAHPEAEEICFIPVGE